MLFLPFIKSKCQINLRSQGLQSLGLCQTSSMKPFNVLYLLGSVEDATKVFFY